MIKPTNNEKRRRGQMKKKNSEEPTRFFARIYSDAMESPAWQDLSHGARVLFLELKKHYRVARQDAVYLSVREAQQRLRCSKSSVIRFFAELVHYGFIEKVRVAKFGEGGLAPHYPLTDEIYLGKPPTNDFSYWNGVSYRRTVPIRTPGGVKLGTYTGVKLGTYGKGHANRKNSMISKKAGVKLGTYLDVSPYSLEGEAGVEPAESQQAADGVVVPIGTAAGKLPWSTPTLTEITDTELGRQLLENRAGSRRLLARK
jgi:hypothetical protein